MTSLANWSLAFVVGVASLVWAASYSWYAVYDGRSCEYRVEFGNLVYTKFHMTNATQRVRNPGLHLYHGSSRVRAVLLPRAFDVGDRRIVRLPAWCIVAFLLILLAIVNCHVLLRRSRSDIDRREPTSS